MSAPRILHVGKFYPPAPGGMEKVVQLLCESERAFERLDSRVIVASTGTRTVRESWRGVPVTRVGSVGAIGTVGLCPTFPLELARAARDLTVIHEPNPVALVADAAARQHGPLVVWFHSEVLRPQWKYRLMYRPFLRRVLARAARIVVSSPHLRDHAAELHPFRDKCVVIPFGLDVDRLAPTPEIMARAHRLRDPAAFRLLFIGRLVPYKGVDVLLHALQRGSAHAWIVGDGPLRAQLEGQARDLAVADRVRFVGSVADDDVAAHLHACDALVLPSITHAETFGMVQLEAMACGKPVISTNVRSGVPWVNRDGETGLVVAPGSAEGLAEAIARLQADAMLRQRMGDAGRRRVAQDFTLSAMARQTAQLYRDVMSHPAAADKQAVSAHDSAA